MILISPDYLVESPVSCGLQPGDFVSSGDYPTTRLPDYPVKPPDGKTRHCARHKHGDTRVASRVIFSTRRLPDTRAWRYTSRAVRLRLESVKAQRSIVVRIQLRLLDGALDNAA